MGLTNVQRACYSGPGAQLMGVGVRSHRQERHLLAILFAMAHWQRKKKAREDLKREGRCVDLNLSLGICISD